MSSSSNAKLVMEAISNCSLFLKIQLPSLCVCFANFEYFELFIEGCTNPVLDGCKRFCLTSQTTLSPGIPLFLEEVFSAW